MAKDLLDDGTKLLEEGSESEPKVEVALVDRLEPWQRYAIVGVFVLIGLLSFFVMGEYASSAKSHAGTISVLDEKKDTVMSLVAGSTGTSTAITLLPGDAGTPIAEKLLDLSSDFLIVIAAIYLEKYLLTIVGFVAFKIMVPISCALFSIAVMLRSHAVLRVTIARGAAKMALLGIALYLVVPASVFVSSMIERTYEASINETMESARQTTEAIEESVQEEQEGDKKEQGLLETIANLPQAISQIPDEVSKFVADAEKALNEFIEALAVMVVTSCVIPLLVLVLFLWLIKVVLGVSVDVPLAAIRPKTLGWRWPRR